MIPTEVAKFFENEGGHSLIIKGEPGSGKTTLALEILEQFRKKKEVMYISTRVADSTLISQFPWVKDIVKYTPKKKNGKISRKHLNMLEGLIEEGFVKENISFDGDEAILEVGELLPELETIYDFVASHKNALVCIDSIDGLSEKYGIPPEKILFTIQKDIVESGHGSMIFVLEETSTKGIDYLADGVISLYHEAKNRFWKRVLVIHKLRGAVIGKPRYLYTLSGGRFTALDYTSFSMDLTTPDVNSLVSLLKDYSRYRCLNFEMSNGVPKELVESLIIAVAKYSGNVVVIPPLFYPGDLLETQAKNYGVENMNIVGFGNDKREMYLEGSDMLVELAFDVLEYHAGKNFTVVIGVDTMAHVYGNLNDLPSLINNLKHHAKVVLLSPEGYSVGGGIDYTIHMDVMEDIPVVLGTIAYGITNHDRKSLKLLPLV